MVSAAVQIRSPAWEISHAASSVKVKKKKKKVKNKQKKMFSQACLWGNHNHRGALYPVGANGN